MLLPTSIIILSSLSNDILLLIISTSSHHLPNPDLGGPTVALLALETDSIEALDACTEIDTYVLSRWRKWGANALVELGTGTGLRTVIVGGGEGADKTLVVAF